MGLRVATLVSYLAVLPSIFPDWTDACLHGCRLDPLMVIDNAHGENRGVAASWNLAAERVIAEELDWLIVVSAAMRFGPRGGLDLVDALDARPDAWVVEAHVFGWHCVAFSRQTLLRVGLFDENFWPAYFEDLDYSWRLRLAGIGWVAGTPWDKVPVGGYEAGAAHGIRLAGIVPDADLLREYFRSKWGAYPGTADPLWDHPFNDPSAGLGWWPETERGGRCSLSGRST